MMRNYPEAAGAIIHWETNELDLLEELWPVMLIDFCCDCGIGFLNGIVKHYDYG
jgi:hypothetical protein